MRRVRRSLARSCSRPQMVFMRVSGARLSTRREGRGLALGAARACGILGGMSCSGGVKDLSEKCSLVEK